MSCVLHGDTPMKGCPGCEDTVPHVVIDATAGVDLDHTLLIEAFEVEGMPDHLFVNKEKFAELLSYKAFEAAALRVWGDLHPDEVDQVRAHAQKMMEEAAGA
jgi:hypothetical protein